MSEPGVSDRPEIDQKPRTPFLTVAAFALLLLIPVMLIAGDVKVTKERVTIDVPVLHLRGEGLPDIDIAR